MIADVTFGIAWLAPSPNAVRAAVTCAQCTCDRDLRRMAQRSAPWPCIRALRSCIKLWLLVALAAFRRSLQTHAFPVNTASGCAAGRRRYVCNAGAPIIALAHYIAESQQCGQQML